MPFRLWHAHITAISTQVNIVSCTARAVIHRFSAAVGSSTDVPLTDPGLAGHQMRAHDTTERREPGLARYTALTS